MNIFVLDLNQKRCAEYHNCRHTVKMVTETAQLLSTAVNLSGGTTPYKSTHVNHPCSLFTRQSRGNYDWLLGLFDALLCEYRYRYGRKHKCGDYFRCFQEQAWRIPAGELTEFALAMPDYCKLGDAVLSYRNYYISEKRHLASWVPADGQNRNGRPVPFWWS